MKALRIKAFQETACYTRPFANKVTETYPLPPYSTVKGMIHSLLDAKELIPFSLSIQGDYETMLIDYRKTYFVKRNTVNMPIIFEGLAVETPEFPDMTSMPLYTHMLYNVDLVIHVHAEEEILNQIYTGFKELTSHLSLGRQEDLIRLDAVEFVELEEVDLFEGVKSKHSLYIPTELVYEDELSTGIPYQLNWTYEIKNGIREWQRIPVIYIDEEQFINHDIIDGTVYIDNEQNIIVWNN